ncbi:MAG TPA: DUF4396 domain-containing protein [Myxococcales bacterium LLY-WYZ-16_1]|nr:DUF4396 domain-containing protein [Myxococcales bacterium LLY-WYZ-16_1]
MNETGWLDHPGLLVVLILNSVFAVQVLARDLRRHNRRIAPLMKLVWVLTVIYSGFLGLAVYFYAGRRQIRRDSVWRRGFRSVAHCYSGCGAGEIAGLLLASLIGLSVSAYVAVLTFMLAFAAGLALTIGPLSADGVPLGTATKDALYSESLSIVVMEAVAIGLDIGLAGSAAPSDVRFWTVLFLSLSTGLLAAYPVNVWLIRKGVKSGMANPQGSPA